TISTPVTSLTMLLSSFAKNTASWTVLYIFQLPAMNGMRMFLPISLLIAQRRDARQRPSAEKLERRAAAGRNVRDLVGHARLLDGRDRIAAADDGRPVNGSDRASDCIRSRGEDANLENTHRSVPDERVRVGNQRAEQLDRRRSDIGAQPVADAYVADFQ